MLPVDGPAAVIGMQHRNFGFHRRSRQRRAGLGKFPADLLGFGIQRNGRAVRSQQRAVVFLLAIQGAAPLPITHDVSAMYDGVPGHGTHLSFIERVVDGPPVYRARLGLHDPEILAFESASQVMCESVLGWVEVSLAYVVVPRSEVEIFFDDVV